MKVDIDQKDFGTLCICAIRYCHGRQSYMPSLVQRIVKNQIKHILDNNLQVMIEDCDFQRKCNLYGDERIDKPGWLSWEQFLKNEKQRREKKS